MYIASRWRRLAIVVIVAAASAGSAFAAVSLSSDGNLIQACLDRNGHVRVVESAADCRRDETPISWNIQGPAGAPGPPGTAGPPGPAGPTSVEVKHVTVTLAPDEFKFIVVHCEPGQVATGGGFGSDGPVLFSENSPVGTTGWVVGGRNTTAGAQLQAVGYVVCAPAQNP